MLLAAGPHRSPNRSPIGIPDCQPHRVEPDQPPDNNAHRVAADDVSHLVADQLGAHRATDHVTDLFKSNTVAHNFALALAHNLPLQRRS